MFGLGTVHRIINVSIVKVSLEDCFQSSFFSTTMGR